MSEMESISSSPVTDSSSSASTEAASTPQDTQTSSAVDSSPQGTSGLSEASATPTEPAPPAYQPNFKYKAAGKEYELEEEYRPYVKSAEDEKRIKRLMEQAKGLEPVRAERDEFRTKADTYGTELEQFHSGLKAINEQRSKGEYRGALAGLGLSREEILMAAKQQMEFDALPQHAKDSYYQNQEYLRQNQHLTQYNEQVTSQVAQLATLVRKTELSETLSSPEVSDFQSWYDSLNGKNAFRQRVIETGKLQHQAYGKDLSAEEAVQLVMGEFKSFRGQVAAQQQAAPQMGGSAAPQAPRDVPVIPSAKGASQSAATKGVTSIDDLKRIRMDKYGF